MTKDEALKLALEALRQNRRNHYYCEDQWYSCPKHEDGCFNEAEGDECNCGADKANQEIDFAIAALRQALEQPSDIDAAIKAENEACAKVADSISDKYAFGFYGEVDTADEIASAIRARMK